MNFAGIVPGDTPFENLSADPPPGVGPYKFTESVPNRQFVMEKNAEFNIPGIPKGNIDTITTQIVKSAERQTQDVISGKLDYMQDPPPADLLPQVKAEYSDRFKDQTTINIYYFFVNQKVPPFDKKEVRQAVNYGRGLTRALAPVRRAPRAGLQLPAAGPAGTRGDRSVPVRRSRRAR